MNWHFLIAALASTILVLHGLDVAFIHRDPPPGARIATRSSRRIAGIAVILLALANAAFHFSIFSE
jgi:hypothetical protein